MPHLEFRDELCKDAKEDFSGGGFTVLSEVRGYLGKLVHGSLLQRVQRLHSWMRVFQEALMPKVKRAIHTFFHIK